jgi:TolA-binding protein
MMFRRLLVCVLLAAPVVSFAASKEIVDLQRDVALLQQQLRDLQRSQDEKFAGLMELARQGVDGANKANTGTAVIQSSLGKNLEDLQRQVVGPVVALGTRMDNISNDVRTLQQAVSDMSSLMAKMQSQLNDINDRLKVMSAPPLQAPPPGSVAGGVPGGASDGAPMPATDLYQNALRDKGSGKLDMALQEFSDYLKYYPTNDLAPNSQFYIGMIHFGQGNYEAAAHDFDMVLEKYGDNNSKAKEARLYKGRSLVKIPGHKTEGADEFAELIKRFPGTDEAKQACSERMALGLRCAAPPVSKKGGKR